VDRLAHKLAVVSLSSLMAAPALATSARYTCDGGDAFTADFSAPDAAGGKAMLSFGMGRAVSLPQVLSADGGRYANADMEFWIKGRSATLMTNGVKQTCAAQ
jgi:membrane-bound inhibitor of C-type lysozyme